MTSVADVPGVWLRAATAPRIIAQQLWFELQEAHSVELAIDVTRASLAADAARAAVTSLLSPADAVGPDNIEAAAVAWLTTMRLIDGLATDEAEPLRRVFECAWSPAACAWLSLHEALEGGKRASDVVSRLGALETVASATPFDEQLALEIQGLRVLGETTPISSLLQGYAALVRFRMRAFDESRDRYLALQREEEDANRPASALFALDAARLIEVIQVGPRKAPMDKPTLQARAAQATRARTVALQGCFERLASLSRELDRERVDDATYRVTSIAFGDRICGALSHAVTHSRSVGLALMRHGRIADGFDHLMDALLPSEIENGIKLADQQLAPDLEVVALLPRWRARRDSIGHEGGYATVADWVVDALEPNPEPDDHEAAADWARLRQLARHAPGDLFTAVDVARKACKSLARVCHPAAGAAGRENADLFADIVDDEARGFPLRHDCIGHLDRYLAHWFEDDEIDTAWAIALAVRLTKPLHLETPDEMHALSVACRLLSASRKDGEPQSIAALQSAILTRLDALMAHAGERHKYDQAWFKVAYALPDSEDERRAACEVIFAWIDELLTIARRGRIGAGVNVSFGGYNPVDALAVIARGADAELSKRAQASLVRYLEEPYLSERHHRDAVRAIHSVVLFETEHLQPSLLVEAAWRQAQRPLRPAPPELFMPRNGELQIAGLRVLATLHAHVSADVVQAAFDLLVPARFTMASHERAGLLESFGRLGKLLSAEQRARVLGWFMQATSDREPPVLRGGCAGLVLLALSADERAVGDLCEALLDILENPGSAMLARRVVLSTLASMYKSSPARLPRAQVETMIGLGLRDTFWPVRYHAKRLLRHAGR